MPQRESTGADADDAPPVVDAHVERDERDDDDLHAVDRGAVDRDDDGVVVVDASPIHRARVDPRLLDPDVIERARRVEIYRRLIEEDPLTSIFGRPDSPPRRAVPTPRLLA